MNRKKILNFISTEIVTLFKIGFIPFAPGTFGSIFAILFFYNFIYWFPSKLILILVTILISIISTFAVSIYEKNVNKHDPSEIVVDEFLGIAVTLLAINNNYSPYQFLIALLLFRFFDILKPFPIKYIDQKMKNSFSTILDDLIAGLFAAIILFIIVSNFNF